MKTIIFGFSTTKWPLSWLIRKLQGIDCSHCYVSFETSSGVELVYEAEGMNTHLVNKKNFAKHSMIVREYSIQVTEEKFHEIKAFIEEDIGVGYDWLGLVGYLITYLVKWFSFNWWKIKNPFPSPDKVCSDASAYIYCELLGGNRDLDYDDIDIVYLLNKITSDSRFQRTK